MIIIRYFFSDVCTSCQEAQGPWEDFKRGNAHKAEFVETNISRGDIAQEFNIEGTPSWIIFKDGQEIYRTLGINFTGLQNALDQTLIDTPTPTPEPGVDPPMNGMKPNMTLIHIGLLLTGFLIGKNL